MNKSHNLSIILIFSVFTLFASLTIIIQKSVAEEHEQFRDSGYFHWPMGIRDNGELFMGHGVRLMQNFRHINPNYGNKQHAGVDFTFDWHLKGWKAAVGEPVYAVADGFLVADNTSQADYKRSYPGRVVVIRHFLPDGSTVYSQYGHLDFLRFKPGDFVRRGEHIGTIFPWPSDITNTHLHFSIRNFPFWYYGKFVNGLCVKAPGPVNYPPENVDDLISCSGPGYKPTEYYECDVDLDEKALEEWGWLNPVDFFYAHRSNFPKTVVSREDGIMTVYSEPNIYADKNGILHPSSRVWALEVVEDSTGANHQWYKIKTPFSGFIRGYEWYSKKNSDIHVGEPLTDWGNRWTYPMLDYRFDKDEMKGKKVNNLGFAKHMDGKIVGDATQVYRQDPVLDPDPVIIYNSQYIRGLDKYVQDRALKLDGKTAFVEVKKSLFKYPQGITTEAWIWRESNNSEDAIAGQWYGNQDQWLLTIYPEGYGKLIFTIRLNDGTYETVDYMIPDSSYLRTWVHVAASYSISEGLLLYWDRKEVAFKPVLFKDIAQTSRPIHIGDAGNEWSRFHGRIDDVKIWIPKFGERLPFPKLR